MLRRENFMWAIAIKAEFGLEKLDAQIIEWMNLHRTSADTWVLPPKVASYLRLVPAEKVYYYTAGQEGPNRVNDIVSGGRPHESNKPSARTQDVVEPYAVFKKNNVFLTRSYHVENTGPIDLMNRVSSVGEYFKVGMPLRFNVRRLTPSLQLTRTGDDDCNVGPSYMTCWNNTRIYNEDEDTGYTVTLMEGLRHCMVFNDDGTPRQLEGMEDPIDARDLEQVRVPFPLFNPSLIELPRSSGCVRRRTPMAVCCSRTLRSWGTLTPPSCPWRAWPSWLAP